MNEIIRKNTDAVKRYSHAFMATFGLDLKSFYHPLFGFDVMKFDKAMGCPDDISLRDHIALLYDQATVSLIEKLIDGRLE